MDEKKMREVHFPVDSPEQIVGEIKHGAFSSPLLAKIFKEFGRNAFQRSSACMEFEAFLKRINARGKKCLEIGTYHGITAILLSQYFDKVVCISVDNEPETLMKHKLVDFLQIKNIEFIDLDGNGKKQKLISRMDFDFCYLDGDHAHDTHTDFDLVKKCGRVLFHEYWPLQAPVWNLVNSLPPEEVTIADYDCFAFWQRKTSAL